MKTLIWITLICLCIGKMTAVASTKPDNPAPENCYAGIDRDDHFDNYADVGFRATYQGWGFEVHIDTSNDRFAEFVDDIPKISDSFSRFLTSQNGDIQLKFDAKQPHFVLKVLEFFEPYKDRVESVYLQGFGTDPIDVSVAVLKALEVFDKLSVLHMNVDALPWRVVDIRAKHDAADLKTLDQSLAKLIKKMVTRELFWVILPQFAGQESLDAVLDGVKISVIDLSKLDSDLSWKKLANVKDVTWIGLPKVNDTQSVLSTLAETKVSELAVSGISDADLELISQNQNIAKLSIRSSLEVSLQGLGSLIQLQNLNELALFGDSYQPKDLQLIEEWAEAMKSRYKLKHGRELKVRILLP